MNEFVRRAVAHLRPISALEMGKDVSGVKSANAPVLRDYSGKVVIAYAVVEERGLVLVQHRHLQESGISEDELHRYGMDNLEQLCNKHLRVEQHGPIYGVFLDGNFEASLLLIDALWESSFAKLVKNGYAIAIPARDVLAFCDADSDEGKAALRKTVDNVTAHGDHLISDELFRKFKLKA